MVAMFMIVIIPSDGIRQLV